MLAADYADCADGFPKKKFLIDLSVSGLIRAMVLALINSAMLSMGYLHF